MGKKQSKAASERLVTVPREEARVVIATGKYVGEGFDDPRLDTLFLTLPVSWRGTITQYAGRLHRLYDGKREVQNERLPIAFDANGALEVDLLCADARVAIELDGAQHLADRDAYRCDRRKDQLLQENGYFVLRFLAEDVGREFDRVLDTILRALDRQRS